MPEAAVIPVLGYPDVLEASGWLCDVFGFRVRLRIADHRVQLVHGDGAVVVTSGGQGTAPRTRCSCGWMTSSLITSGRPRAEHRS